MTRLLHFWPLQLIGWFGYFIVSSLSGIAHGKNLDYLGVTGMVAVAGVFLTWPLHFIYRGLWFRPLRHSLPFLVPSFLAVAVSLGFANAFAIQSYCPDDCTPRNIYGYLAYSGVATYVLLSWTALWFGIRMSRAYTDARASALIAETQAHDAQLKMLRYQLNPHFLFNTLNAISTLVLDRANDTAEQMLGALSRFLRATLDQEPQQRVTVVREIEILNLYLGIEKMRFAERLRLDVRVEPAVEQALVPSLILQPLVENAIKYAVARSEQGCTLMIHATSIGERLRLRVADDGPGCTNLGAECPPGHGVGLRNTRERLATLYPDRHRLDVRNRAEGGVEVIIELPLDRSA